MKFLDNNESYPCRMRHPRRQLCYYATTTWRYRRRKFIASTAMKQPLGFHRHNQKKNQRCLNFGDFAVAS